MRLPPYYKELHVFEDKGQTLYMNEATDTLCILKKHRHGDVRIFEFLKNNSNIHTPAVYDYFPEDDGIAVIEEYIEGVTLDEYLVAHRDRKERIGLIKQLLDAVEYCHNAKPPIINRDLKLSNIMVTKDGTLKLIDFDASKLYKPGSPRDTELLGTHGNAAPEQYGFSQSDKRTDIYAIGLLIDQIMPGRYRKAVKCATSMDPRFRFQDIRSFRNALFRKGSSGATGSLVTITITLTCVAAVLIATFAFSFIYGVKRDANKVLAEVTDTVEMMSDEDKEKLIEDPDFRNAEAFENALNNGKDVEGAVVRFKVIRVATMAGTFPDLWGGKHLNFLSYEPVDAEEGDIITVRVCSARKHSYSWFISYELIDISED